jgi:hypothetical protein
MDPMAAWVATAIYAKMCGATDPAAIAVEVARLWVQPPASCDNEIQFAVYETNIRRIEEASARQKLRGVRDA